MKSNYEIIKEDVIHFAQTYNGEKFHALLCDPPYHLTTITKRFGKNGSAPAKFGKDGSFSRLSKGFMNQKWDGGDIAFRSETWSAFMPLLYPGAFGMAFASARGFHRLACAIEDAGFILHPFIGWCYGSGFPKATRLKGKGSRTFAGHRYGLQALKPALEPILVFQKPFNGKPKDDILEYGTGAMNIDRCRIEGEPVPINKLEEGSGFGQKERPDYVQEINNKGRWPANLIHDGSEEVLKLFPDTKSGELKVGQVCHQENNNIKWGDRIIDKNRPSNSGSAARFFYCAKSSKREKNEGLNIPETTVSDGRKKSVDNAFLLGETPRKNTHPCIKPLDLCRYLSTLLLPPNAYSPRRIFVPFAGTGSEMIGAIIAGWEEIVGVEFMPEYVKLAQARLSYWKKKGILK